MMNVPITSYFSPKDWLNIRYGDIVGDAEVWYLYEYVWIYIYIYILRSLFTLQTRSDILLYTHHIAL